MRHTLLLLPALLLAACGDGGIYVQNNEPVATIVSPLDGALVLLGSPVVFSALAEDRDTAPRGLDLSWTSSVDGLLVGTTAIEGDSVLFELIDELSLGGHEIHFTIRDPRDAEDTAAITISVQQNAAPLALVEAPLADTAIRRGEDLEIRIQLSDDFTPLELLALSWTGLPQDVAGPSHGDATGLVSLTLTAPEFGEHEIGLTVGDDAGLEGGVEISFRVFVDEDEDGYESGEFGGDDCDDADLDQHPAAPEFCNSEDDDCDLDVDEDGALDAAAWFADVDTDTFGDLNSVLYACDQPDGTVENGNDCDDTLLSVHPGADEYCNGRDDNCNLLVDEGSALDADLYWADGDGDTFGDSSVVQPGCSPPLGFVTNDDDCDDALSVVYPAAPELCDTLDNDCDTAVDEVVTTFWADGDGDGYGDLGDTTTACAAPPGYVSNDDDCDDDAPGAFPGGVEYCEGTDEDCNTLIDDNAVNASAWYVDADGDGYGDSTSVVYECDGGGLTTIGGDCADDDEEIHPGATEVCDGIDNDCDPLTDDERAVPGEYTTIQAAINASADGDIVCVAEGTFAGPVDFLGKDLTITGQGPYVSIVDATFGGVSFQSGETAAASFSGFSIENGSASQGGALMIDGADPSVSNIVFYNNTCTSTTLCQGPVIFLSSTSSTFDELLVEGNTIAPMGGGIYGGLVWMENADVTWSNSAFRYNTIDAGGAAGACALTPAGGCIDGGVVAMVDSNPVFDHVDWDGNVIDTYTYVHLYPWTPIVGQSVHGGVFFMDHSSPQFRWNRVTDNSLDSWQIEGGVAWVDDRSHPTFAQSVISRVTVLGVSAWAQSSVEGGVFYIDTGTGSGPVYSSVGLDQVDVLDIDITTDLAWGGLAWVYGTTSTAPSAQNYTNCGLDLHNTIVGGISMLSRATPAPVASGLVLYSTTSSYTGHTRLDLDYSDFHGNVGCMGTWASCTAIDEFGNFSSPVGTDGNVAIVPSYTSTTAPISSLWDLHLDASSILGDAGDPGVVDTDGSRSAMGAYGGPDSAGW